MKIKILTLITILCVMFSINLFAGIQDKCGTTSGSSAPYIPTSGNIKVLVIFAQFKDDPQINHNGWAKNSFPDWGSTFVNTSPNGTYPWNNLSHYFNEMSNGTFQVIGNVYNLLVITDYNESYYSSIGQVNREIIMKVDPYVNFAEYDNLNGNSFGSDGKVDFIYIIYRNATSSHWYYSGIALLEVSSTIDVDGKQIVNNSYIGGGVQQRGGYNGRDYTLYVAAHEMGHYLFGGGHIHNVSNLALMTGEPVWNASRGMHSWERQKLGWISFTDKSTDGSITMFDYITTDQVYRVPINSSEYFLIENRQKLSSHDQAGDTGFYFYKINWAQSYPPAIDVLCADGNWDFSINTSTQTLTRTTPNVNGNDEMNFRQVVSGITYACYTPVYHENSAWGDNEDAFDLTFNNVLSPVSNPRSTNSGSLNFTIEITGTNTIQFYFSNPYAGSPSKPQNLQITTSGRHPLLSWDANSESDLSEYIIYWQENSGGWVEIARTPSTSYLDTQTFIDMPYNQIDYCIVAKDNDNKYSVKSDYKSVMAMSMSILDTNALAQIKTEVEETNINFALSNNYPNPFNPTTKIYYSLNEASFVTLKVFDILGREVTTLVNEIKSSGKHEVEFDASELPSGTYIYKLTAGNYQTIRKMLLIK